MNEYQNQGEWIKRTTQVFHKTCAAFLFSFIQTIPVGFGFTPNLLTLRKNAGKITRTFVSNARGLTLTRSPPVGTFTLP